MDSLKTEKIRVVKQGDVFITKTATKTLTSTQTVEKVINFHFRDLIRALRTYDSVEITGFGRFTISQNKLKRKIKHLEITKANLLDTEKKGKYNKSEEAAEKMLAQVEIDLAYLKSKQTEDETKLERHYRRVAQSLDASCQAEESDPTDQ